MNSLLPADVKDAIHKLSEFVEQNGYAEIVVFHADGASFTRKSNRKKEEKNSVIAILAAIAAAILLLSSLVIIGINLFKPLPQLHERGWMLILLGSSVLSGMATIEPIIGNKEMRATSIVAATFATFVFLGLALLSTSTVLSTLFYGMAFSSFVFGPSSNAIERGIRQIQRLFGTKPKAM